MTLAVPYLALDASASGVYNCTDGASPAYEVDAFVGGVMVGTADAGFAIRDAVVRVVAENGTTGAGSVGAWAANLSGVAEVGRCRLAPR